MLKNDSEQVSKKSQAEIELSIVVPLKDESLIIDRLISAIQKALNGIEDSFEIILVDDGSQDNSWAEIVKAGFNRGIRGIRLCRNFGKEAALRAGLEYARGAAVITMDADFQHPPELISELLACWRKGGVEIVEAVRRNPPIRTAIQHVGARVIYTVFQKVTGVDIERKTDYRLLDRSVVDFVSRLPERAIFFRGILAWYGFKTVSVPFDVVERETGSSRWSLIRLVSFGLDVVTGFTSFPLRLMTLSSIAFLSFSFFLILQTLYGYFTHRSIEGFTTVIISILLVGGVVTAGLGIIGEYLARIYEEVKQRPRFRVSETVEDGDVARKIFDEC